MFVPGLLVNLNYIFVHKIPSSKRETPYLLLLLTKTMDAIANVFFANKIKIEFLLPINILFIICNFINAIVT